MRHFIQRYSVPLFFATVMSVLVGSTLYGLLEERQNERSFESNSSMTLLPLGRSISNITLIRQDGRGFTQADLQGHWSLVFFGYTGCPSLCPATLMRMESLYAALKHKSQVQLVFISMNPEEDTPSVLEKYFEHRDGPWIALTGEHYRIADLAKQLGAYINATETGLDGHIAHSGSVYLINPKGEYQGLISDMNQLASIQHELDVLTKP